MLEYIMLLELFPLFNKASHCCEEDSSCDRCLQHAQSCAMYVEIAGIV